MSVTSRPPSPVVRVFGARPFHTDGDLLALAFAPDGGLWSAEEPGVLRRWDVEARRQTALHALDEVATVWAFSRSAKRAAAASDELSVWDVASGEEAAGWPQPSWVTAVAFQGDDGLIATGHDDHVVRLWERGNGNVVRELRGHDMPVSAVAFSPDGRRLASAGEDRLIRLWEVATGSLLGTFAGHTDRVPALAWQPDGTRLYSAGWDTTVRVWDVATFEPVILLNDHAAQVHTLAVSPNGSLLASADSANVVHVWDARAHRTVAALREQAGEVRALAFSPDGRRLASGGVERLVHVWDARRGPDPEDLADPLVSRTGLAATPDGRLASLGAGTPLRVWDVATGAPGATPRGVGALRAFAASPDGRWFAASLSGPDGPDEWDAKTTPYADAPRATLGLWDARTGEKRAMLEGQRAPITALAFAPDGATLASGSFRGSDVWLWNVPGGEPALLIPDAAEDCSVEAVAFQPGGRLLAVAGIDWLATGGDDGRVVLWDRDTQRPVGTLPGGAVGVAFHPGGGRLAVASPAQAVRIFDVVGRNLVAELIGHLDAVTCVAYSPDGRWLASGGDDRTVRLWDVTTGLQKGVAELDTQVKALAFAPDGRSLFTGNGNTSCYQLDVGRVLAEGT